MNILAIDTSTQSCSVALAAETTVLGEILIHEQHHSETLIRLIEHLLEHTSTDVRKLHGVAVSIGPGTFTGLRVGISTAQGLALALGLPLVGVSSLEILARQALPAQTICPMIEANKGQVYTCLYTEADTEGIGRAIGERVTDIEPWITTLPEVTVFTGPGAIKYRNRILVSYRGKALFAPVSVALPRASTLAAIARERFLEGRSGVPEQVTAQYIRPPDALLK